MNGYYVVQINPISCEETVIGRYRTTQEVADALGCSKSSVENNIRDYRMNRYGCYVMRWKPNEADK